MDKSLNTLGAEFLTLREEKEHLPTSSNYGKDIMCSHFSKWQCLYLERSWNFFKLYLELHKYIGEENNSYTV